MAVTTASGISGLSPLQTANARIIVNVGQSLDLPKKAYIVAIAVAMQESQLGAAKGINTPNADGDAGVFQQRCKKGWYGTLAQVTDTAYAARVFYAGKKLTATDIAGATNPAGPVGYVIPGLMQIKGWQAMSVTQAAQAVQRSAYPMAYAKHEARAAKIVGEIVDNADPVSSGAIASGGGVNIPPMWDWVKILVGVVLVVIALVKLSGTDDVVASGAKVAVSAYTKGLVNVK